MFPDTWFLIMITIFIIISLICEFLLIYIFLKFNRLKNYLDFFTFIQCICQIGIDLHWLTILPEINSRISDSACQLFGALFSAIYFISWDINTIICFELYIIVKYPRITTIKTRIKLYYLLILISGVVVFILLEVDSQNGRSPVGTCSIQSNSKFEAIFYAQIFGYNPICLFLLISTCIRLRKKPELKNSFKYTFYLVMSFMILMFLPTITGGLQWGLFEHKYLYYLSIITGVLLGSALFVVRIKQRKLGMFFYRLIHCKKRLTIESSESLLIKFNPCASFMAKLENYKEIDNVLIMLECIFENFPEKFEPNIKGSMRFDILKEVDKIKITFKHTDFFSKLINIGFKQLTDFKKSFAYLPNKENLQQRLYYSSSTDFNFYTSDNRFIIKSLTETNFQLLSKIIPAYSDRILKKKSFLTKIYGLFKLDDQNSHKIYFYLIENTGSKLSNPITTELINIQDELNDLYLNTSSSILSRKDMSHIKFKSSLISNIIKNTYLDISFLAKCDFLQYNLIVITDSQENNKNLRCKNLLEFEDSIGYLCINFYIVSERLNNDSRSKMKDFFIQKFNKILFKDHYLG